MRQRAIALVVMTVAALQVLPAAAQVGIYGGPAGISVNVGPGYYVYGQYPYHHHLYHWRHGPYRRSW